MPATKRGIYHNLRESEYVITNGEIMLFFSSKLYLTMFMKEYKQYRKQLEKRLRSEALNMDTLADITLYGDIEKRGFLAWLKGVSLTWDEIHKYALRKMTDANTNDWYEIQKPKLTERVRIME